MSENAMKLDKITKVENAKKTLSEKGITFDELQNGHLKVDGINFWATSGKWYDAFNGEKGNGINSFIKYLKVSGTI